MSRLQHPLSACFVAPDLLFVSGMFRLGTHEWDTIDNMQVHHFTRLLAGWGWRILTLFF